MNTYEVIEEWTNVDFIGLPAMFEHHVSHPLQINTMSIRAKQLRKTDMGWLLKSYTKHCDQYHLGNWR